MKKILQTLGLVLGCFLHLITASMEKPALNITISGPHAIGSYEKTFYAYIEGKQVGKILFLINPYTKTARIQLIKVDAQFRKSGIGFALFKKCISYISKMGCSTINWVAYPIDSVELNELITIYLRMIQKLHTHQGFEFTMRKTQNLYGTDCLSLQLKIRK